MSSTLVAAKFYDKLFENIELAPDDFHAIRRLVPVLFKVRRKNAVNFFWQLMHGGALHLALDLKYDIRAAAKQPHYIGKIISVNADNRENDVVRPIIEILNFFGSEKDRIAKIYIDEIFQVSTCAEIYTFY